MSLAEALAARDVARLPCRRDEDWRWTDLRGLLRVLPPQAGAFEGAVRAGPFAALGEGEALFVNGELRSGADLLVLEGGERTLRLRFVAASGETAQAAQAAVRVGPGASMVLLESHEHLSGGYVADVRLDIEVAEGGQLERIVLVDDDAEAVRVATASVKLGPSARFSQTLLSSGARRQRLETRLAHPGAGAEARLDGVYVVTGKRHADMTSQVVHGGVDGVTSQLTKGVADDQARAVFQGRIVVEQGADRTDARMGHHALILSDRAEVDAKPELEIYADDVACAHGATVGALDEDVLFYVRQRGLPLTEARALLTLAFLGEVVDRIQDDQARAIADGWLQARLGGLHGV